MKDKQGLEEARHGRMLHAGGRCEKTGKYRAHLVPRVWSLFQGHKAAKGVMKPEYGNHNQLRRARLISYIASRKTLMIS